jgi:hypothetical protein
MPYADSGSKLILEMVKGTRIPWNAGGVRKLALSGLKN